jgi:DNA-binding transcriptional ArsR family regulator
MEASAVFAALGDPTRLEIVTRLCREGPASITRLTDGARVTRQAISKHLQVLARAGVVRGHRQGRETRWDLQAGRLDVARSFLDLVSRRWDVALERLRTAVEAPRPASRSNPRP